MKVSAFSRIFFAVILGGILATPSVQAGDDYTLTRLTSSTLCNRCVGYWLPGEIVPSPRTFYRIDSDLPEMYLSNGVLYATTGILPPMKTKEGVEIPETMRQQINNGFKAIDNSFEVFLYHLSQNHAPGETRRIVVYAKNIGQEPATLTPRQAVFYGPNAGKLDSVESQLGEAVLTEQWERPINSLTIEPGQGGIVGFTKQLGAGKNSGDESSAVFTTGILRADMALGKQSRPQLEVYVVSIPGTAPQTEWIAQTESLLTVGAQSGEGSMDLLIPPPPCHVRRVVGTSFNAMWRNEPLFLDVNALDAEGVPFLMALPRVQAGGCEDACQTADLLLHPPYVHSDTVGNYMMEYFLTFRLTNNGTIPRKVDLQFGKMDARIGLGYQALLGETEKSFEDLEKLPVHIAWKGKGTEGLMPPFYSSSIHMNVEGADKSQTFNLSQKPIAPGEMKVLNIRLMVLGTSSLPYHLIFKPIP